MSADTRDPSHAYSFTANNNGRSAAAALNASSVGSYLHNALVRGLAELHGGRAWLESDEGAGCSAFIVLPTKMDEKNAAA